MALICDTGGIYALYDADDAHHSAVRAVVEAEVGPLFLPSILLAELDYLLTTRLGTDAELDFLEGDGRSLCPDPSHNGRFDSLPGTDRAVPRFVIGTRGCVRRDDSRTASHPATAHCR